MEYKLKIYIEGGLTNELTTTDDVWINEFHAMMISPKGKNDFITLVGDAQNTSIRKSKINMYVINKIDRPD